MMKFATLNKVMSQKKKLTFINIYKYYCNCNLYFSLLQFLWYTTPDLI